MLKTNHRRQAVGDGAAAGSKLDVNLGIEGAPKTPSMSEPASPATGPDNLPSTPLIVPKVAPAPATINSGGGRGDSLDQTKLNSLKQQALTKLSPLVEDLEQPPLEHFRTLMMLIQATDNSELLNRALETANSIDDDKDRAQALLDIVNEINYFTAQANKDKSAPN